MYILKSNGDGYIKTKLQKLSNLFKIKKEDKGIVTQKTTPKISLASKFKKYKGNNLAKEFSWDDENKI